LSPIKEKPLDLDEISQHSSSTGRQPLGEIELSSVHSNSTTTSQKSLSLSSDHDQENVEIKRKSDPITTNEPAKKRQKKIVQKPLAAGQKSIKNFFQSKN